MKKKLLSILLCLCMVVTLLPTAAMAVGEVTLHVSASAANDTAARSDGAIYQTLPGAVNKAQSGDTIQIDSDLTMDQQ